MSTKLLFIISILLFQIFTTTTTNTQICSPKRNATTCVGCNDVCGASIQTAPSCCVAYDLEVIKGGLAQFTSLNASASCRTYLVAELCNVCSPLTKDQKVCKSFCQKIGTECENVYISLFGKPRECSNAPDTNCFDYIIPKQVSIANSGILVQFSDIVMICLSVILAVFAL